MDRSSNLLSGDIAYADIVAAMEQYLRASRQPHPTLPSQIPIGTSSLDTDGAGSSRFTPLPGDAPNIAEEEPADYEPECPSLEQYNRVPFPPAYGTLDFSSFICSIYAKKQPPVWKHQMEVADYCIAPNTQSEDSEILYMDNWPPASLTRLDFYTFEINHVVSFPILTAWARVMNSKWDGPLRSSVCMEPINLDDNLHLKTEDLFQQWDQYVDCCNLNLPLADLIFLPVRKSGHYALLVVNFKENKFQFVDSVDHEHKDRWMAIFKLVVSYFLRYMARYDDHRFMRVVDDFVYELISPRWSTSDEDVDSGIFVMLLMEIFRGSADEVHRIRFNEPNYRMRKRIVFCSRIAYSTTNYNRHMVMRSVALHVHHKFRSA